MQGWIARFRVVLGTGIKWWFGELAALVPTALKQFVSAWQTRLLLIVDESGAYLVQEGVRGEPFGRVALGAEPDAGIVAALGQRRFKGAEVVVRLPSAQALRSAIALPLAAERNLDHVIGYEFERLTPFKRADVYYAARIVRRDTVARHLHLELTMVPRVQAEAVLSQARHMGLRVVGLEVGGPDDGGGSPNLLPLAERPVAPRRMQWAVAALGGLAALLAIAAITIPFARLDTRLDRATARLEDAKRQAQVTLALQKQIEAETRDGQFLVARRSQTPTITELLAALTHLVPDDTWLLGLQFSVGQLHMSGFSPSATGLLDLLARSSFYADPAFVSSVTQDAASKRERFDLVARIVKRDAP